MTYEMFFLVEFLASETGGILDIVVLPADRLRVSCVFQVSQEQGSRQFSFLRVPYIY